MKVVCAVLFPKILREDADDPVAVDFHAGFLGVAEPEAILPSVLTILIYPSLKNLYAVDSLILAEAKVHFQSFLKEHRDADQEVAYQISYQRELGEVGEDMKSFASDVFVLRREEVGQECAAIVCDEEFAGLLVVGSEGLC